jgi:TRAP-type C4-dicarboxylate transport system substrate-binding protein
MDFNKMKLLRYSLLLFSLLAGPACSVERSVIKLEFSGALPSHDKLSLMFEDWCRDLNRRSGGSIEATFYPGGILTSAPQTFDSVTTGIADIGFGPVGVTPGRFPLTEVMELPLGIKSAFLMTRLSNDFFRAFRPKELAQVKVLFFLSASPGVLHTKKPVAKLEDLRGMKVRCLGGTAAKVLKALGAIPIVISTGDTYDALRKGIVDGVVAAWDSLETLKWGEVLPYTTVSDYASVGAPGFVVMNKARWELLPLELQNIIDEMSVEYAERLSRLWDEKDRSTMGKWEAKNHVSIFLSREEERRWEQAIRPLYETFVETKSARGLDAAEALKFCREWVRENSESPSAANAGTPDVFEKLRERNPVPVSR